MRFVCVFEAVYVCVCAGQSKTGSIVKAFETLLSYNDNTDSKNTRFRAVGDPVSMFDRGVDITVNKNSYNPLYNHGFHAVHYGDMGKSEKNVAEPIRAIM